METMTDNLPIAIIDYGIGNLRSVQKAFGTRGHRAEITSDADIIRRADRVVLPGVGAFGAGIDMLRERGLEAATLEAARSGKPFLGICVGMQLLFSVGEEMGIHRGLDLIPGRVVRFAVTDRKIPQIGWNNLYFGDARAPIFAGLPDEASVYFLHSYHCVPDDENIAIARTDFGGCYTSAVRIGNLYGVQFHPEKSGANGLQILDNFARL